MGAGCGFAQAKHHFVPFFFSSDTSARNMKETRPLDPHLGCTLSRDINKGLRKPR